MSNQEPVANYRQFFHTDDAEFRECPPDHLPDDLSGPSPNRPPERLPNVGLGQWLTGVTAALASNFAAVAGWSAHLLDLPTTPTTAREAIEQSRTALVCLGPGGEFVTSIMAQPNGSLAFSEPISEPQAHQSAISRMLSSPVIGTSLREGLSVLACESHLASQARLLASVRGLLGTTSLTPAASPPSGFGAGRSVPRHRNRLAGHPAGHAVGHPAAAPEHFVHLTETLSDEPHPQAAPNPLLDPRLAHSSRLFADDARTGRRDRREQGHRVRTRRSPDQEGCPDPRGEQGSLFVDR